jgi:sulfite reductase alpha subunit-like flavoprotein
VHPTRIHITLAVLEKKTVRRADGGAGEDGAFRGLCSGHLAGLGIGDTVRAFVRESSFRLPARAESPVIMLGPRTGIAPMRAILQERSHMRRTAGSPAERHRIWPSVLYFGCKDQSMDFIYREELEAFADEGTLTELSTSPSPARGRRGRRCTSSTCWRAGPRRRGG